MAGQTVPAYAQYYGIAGSKLLQPVIEIDRLTGSTGGIVLGIKIEHNFLAGKLPQGDFAAPGSRQGEIRSFFTDYNHTLNLLCQIFSPFRQNFLLSPPPKFPTCPYNITKRITKD